MWTAYNKASSKKPAAFSPSEHTQIPLSILRSRELGMQESIVTYLKDNLGWSYHEIALALKRNDRTVWTAYQRAGKKSKRGK